MKKFIITKKDLVTFLNKLIKKVSVIAPQKNEFDDVQFLPLDNADRASFDYENTVNNPKEYFFPDSECMFTYKRGKAGSIKAPKVKGNFVLFGIRPCDTRAVKLLDKFFSNNFEDNLYLQRCKASTLITLACPDCWEECFCTSLGTGPVLEDGFDIQLIPFDSGYLAEVGSEKGANLFQDFKGLFKPAADKDTKKLSEFREKFKKEKPRFDFNKVYKNLKENKIPDALWQDIALRCQSCGLCLFICPACSCFTVNDREKATGLEARVRQWDACYFRGFTRMAGNQSPIAGTEEMVRRKYVHKLWQEVDEFGMAGCTGCGRCNTCCVGNVNWLENLVKIAGE